MVRTGISISSTVDSEKTYTLKTLKKGDSIIVEYMTNKEGVHRAMAIKSKRWKN
jgi:hypothetical protein